MTFGPLVPKRKLMATEGGSEITKSFINTLTNQIYEYVNNYVYQFLEGDYLPITGGTMLGDINMNNYDLPAGKSYDADTVKVSDGNTYMDSNGLTLKNTDIRLQTADAAKTATIDPDANANIIMTPYTGGYTHHLGNTSLALGSTFGPILATASDGYIFWFTNSGTRDHVLGPDTTKHGKIGNASYIWLEGHYSKLYAYDEMYIPAEA